MTIKPVVLRALARQDIEAAVDHYREEAGERVALRFVAALEQALRHVARHPATGSPRYAHGLDLPRLRTWRVKRHPHRIFYVERDDHVDVWRVLHGQRDIPAWLAAPEDE